MRRFLINITVVVLLSLVALPSVAQDSPRTQNDVPSDSLLQVLLQMENEYDQTNKGWFRTWWEGLSGEDVDHTFDRPVDISIALSPFYAQEMGFAVGGTASAFFRLNRNDSVMQPSNVSLMGSIATSGTFAVGLMGNIHFTRDERLSFFCNFRNQNRDFWGFDFATCDHHFINKDYTSRNLKNITLRADYQQRFTGHWFWGASARINYMKLTIDNELFRLDNVLPGQQQRPEGFFTGLGALIQYDSRDLVFNASHGIYFLLREVYYPRVMSTNHGDIFTTTLQFSTYRPLWQGAVLAYDFFSEFSLSKKDIPWQLRQEICPNDDRMRGYYMGSYTDDNQLCTQVELRQAIVGRLGAVAFGGVGTIFHDPSEIYGRQILPNYGVGLRYELKHRNNIRIDFGMGRGCRGVVFNIGEAF